MINNKNNRISLLQLILLCAAAFGSPAFAQKAQIKNVAVIETQIDEHSGAAEELSKAEVRLITNEIRREAIKNLPRGRFNVMTSETVMSMGDAVLEECAEENCVIALGSKIGADFIVRGIISKFREFFTITIEMYETEYGMLVATADPVRTENLHELLEKSTTVCTQMYKTFLETNLAGKPSANQEKKSFSENELKDMVRDVLGVPKPSESPQDNANVTSPPPPAPPKPAAPSKPTKRGYIYFTPKWDISGLAWGDYGLLAFNIEAGTYSRSGSFLGLDMGFGMDMEMSSKSDNEKFGLSLGLALNMGQEFYSANTNSQIAFGGSIGFWLTHSSKTDYSNDTFWGETKEYFEFGFTGPLIRLRWQNIELFYRGLIGFGYKSHYIDILGDIDSDFSLTYTSQLMLGYQLHSRPRRKK